MSTRIEIHSSKIESVVASEAIEIGFAFLFYPCYNPRLPLYGVRIAAGLSRGIGATPNAKIRNHLY
ncbi:MAG: hypothetical protein M1347_01455, partial [Chloroflexi bacterium]|nr:hypothetical protein [Chloroflexota bacterium]